MRGMVIDYDRWDRSRIPTANIENVISDLERLKEVIRNDAAYAKRRPKDVIDRIILVIEDAAPVQRRPRLRGKIF